MTTDGATNDAAGNEPTPAEAMAAIKQSVKSLMLATIGADGEPHISYAPFVLDETGAMVIFISELAEHTRDLLDRSLVSAMLIADERASVQIFARLRLRYQCRAEHVERGDARYAPLLDAYEARQGKTVQLLRQLADFRLFRLVPESGLLVMGFGKAYHLKGKQLDEFEHARTA